jgi:hypothetical protein
MKPLLRLFAPLYLVLAPLLLVSAADPYKEDFNAASEVPNTIMVLNGEFSIKEEGGNKIFEVEPVPLDTYTALFGPAGKEDIMVRGRAKAEAKGRRFPVFGFGLGGVTGTVLRLSGAKKALVVVKNDEPLASVDFPFPSDKWVWFHLQIRKTGETWMVEGKAWVEGTEEPKEWMVTVPLDKAPVSGRASCWAVPYSGSPIQFDDFVAEDLK